MGDNSSNQLTDLLSLGDRGARFRARVASMLACCISLFRGLSRFRDLYKEGT